MLSINNVSFKYGDKFAIENLSLNLKPGEILGFLGPNGCGKSTTFRLICGLLTPLTGSITLFNQKINEKNINQISYLIEERALFPKYKVYEMLIYLGKLKGVEINKLKNLIDNYLDKFKMTKYKDKKIETLSKGNQQKIQFIGCLLNSPKLIVLDEPLTGLDVINAKEIFSYINKLKDEGAMIIFSSHQINNVEKFCDKVCLIDKGKTILKGNLKEIKNSYEIKNVEINANNFDDNILKNIDGIINIKEDSEKNIIIKVINEKVARIVFEKIKNIENLNSIAICDETLEEIFIAKVKENRL